QYPAVEFDWNKIIDAPIPSAEADKWRERRRADRAERVARRAGEAVDAGDDESSAVNPDADLVEPDADARGAIASDAFDQPSDSAEASAGSDPSLEAVSSISQPPPREAAARRRRRRRRGRGEGARREQPVAASTDAAVVQAGEPDPQGVTPPDDP